MKEKYCFNGSMSALAIVGASFTIGGAYFLLVNETPFLAKINDFCALTICFSNFCFGRNQYQQCLGATSEEEGTGLIEVNTISVHHGKYNGAITLFCNKNYNLTDAGFSELNKTRTNCIIDYLVQSAYSASTTPFKPDMPFIFSFGVCILLVTIGATIYYRRKSNKIVAESVNRAPVDDDGSSNHSSVTCNSRNIVSH